MNRYKLIISVILVSVTLSGCGIKPSKLSPPENADRSEYPRTYPDLATDPNY